MERPRSCRDLASRMDCAGVVKSSLRVIEGKWKIFIINELMNSPSEPLRFSEIERLIPDVTQKVLIQQLRELEQDGVVLRTVYLQVPPKVEYSLTEDGWNLRPSLAALMDWSETRADHGDQP